MTVAISAQSYLKIRWFGFVALFASYGLFVGEQFQRDLTLLEFRLHTPVAQHIEIGEYLAAQNPELMTYAASALAMKGYELKQSGEALTAYQRWFQAAITLSSEALRLKPMAGEAYRQLANYYWNLGASASVIGEYIAKAQAAEPFERSTLLDSLRYYLSFWQQLTIGERKQAVEYLFDTSKYGINYEWIGGQLDDPALRRKACQIYAFSGKKIEFCMKEFIDLYY